MATGKGSSEPVRIVPVRAVSPPFSLLWGIQPLCGNPAAGMLFWRGAVGSGESEGAVGAGRR